MMMIRGSRTTIKVRGSIPRIDVTLTNELVVAEALPLPTAPKRNRKRKAPESDKGRSNDESATDDANNVVETKRGGESARSNHSFWRKY